MLVFLPDLASLDKPDGLASLERSLSKEKILDCLARLEHQGPVDVTLPRIRLHCVTDLAHLMPVMGAPDAFGEAADFSNMGNVTCSERSEGGGAGACIRLKVSAAKHFAVFNTGLRTATAQSTPPALPPIADYDERPSFDFTVDRPFLFLVLGRDPDSVLLFGSVTRAL
ncbi:iris-like [Amblyomma americanum]